MPCQATRNHKAGWRQRSESSIFTTQRQLWKREPQRVSGQNSNLKLPWSPPPSTTVPSVVIPTFLRREFQVLRVLTYKVNPGQTPPRSPLKVKYETADSRGRPLWPLQLLEPSLTGKAYYPTQLSSTTAAPICPHPHLSLALLFILVPTSFSSHLSWLLTGSSWP